VDLGLNGKVALILGGGGGIGRAVAMSLANEKARVVVADFNAQALQASVSAIEAAGGSALPLEWNLSDLAGIDAQIAKVEAQVGSVDILVNNTGGPPPTQAAGQDASLWLANFESMVLSVIKITDRVLPGMKARQWGRIITSASSGVVAPIPNLAISNALRMSLVGWSKTLAREVARDGITVNVIVPGRIATDRIHFLDQSKAKRENRPLESVVAESTGSIPAGRYGLPREYADVVAFLASAAASYVTGSVVRVDGGLIASV
jgi:3-oxoacyl-[acyl-carrier protein] reductase